MLICLLPSIRGHTSNNEMHSEKYAFSLGFHYEKTLKKKKAKLSGIVSKCKDYWLVSEEW